MTDIKDMSDAEKEELIAELEEHLQQLYSLIPVSPFKSIPEEMLRYCIDDTVCSMRAKSDEQIAEETKRLYDTVKELVDS